MSREGNIHHWTLPEERVRLAARRRLAPLSAGACRSAAAGRHRFWYSAPSTAKQRLEKVHKSKGNRITDTEKKARQRKLHSSTDSPSSLTYSSEIL